jgi:hypothetical protein
LTLNVKERTELWFIGFNFAEEHFFYSKRILKPGRAAVS